MHVYKNFLAYNLKPGKSQQQLFGAGIAELDGSLGIVAIALHLDHLPDAEALMLYLLSHLEGCGAAASCRWCYA